MRFPVPQFIDVEDKVFGPFTFKQFIYLVGGAGMAYLAIEILPLAIGIIVALAIAGFAIALAFVRIHKKPFIKVVEAFIRYMVTPKFYLWQYREPKPKKHAEESTQAEQSAREEDEDNPLSKKRLDELSWGLDILDTESHR